MPLGVVLGVVLGLELGVKLGVELGATVGLARLGKQMVAHIAKKSSHHRRSKSDNNFMVRTKSGKMDMDSLSLSLFRIQSLDSKRPDRI